VPELASNTKRKSTSSPRCSFFPSRPRHRHLARQQVHLHVALNGQAAEPFRKLGEHESRSYICAVDGALGSAGAGVGFVGGEEGGWVVKAGGAVERGEDAEDFGGHASVDEEVRLVLHGVPDQAAHVIRVFSVERLSRQFTVSIHLGQAGQLALASQA